MGFLISFNRKMYLTNYINSLQSKLTEMTEEKLKYTDKISNYTSRIKDIGDSDSHTVKALQALKAELEALDKKMDYEIQKIQTQLQAANQEMQSANEMLQHEVQRTFSYSGVGGGR